MRLYESMFLVDNTRAKEDFDGTVNILKELVTKAGGEVVNCDKWDERKLAYEVGGQRRGTYILSHWNGPPEAPAKLERSARLSEAVLRLMTVIDEDGTEIAKPREEPPRREFGGPREGGGYRDRGDREGGGGFRDRGDREGGGGFRDRGDREGGGGYRDRDRDRSSR